MPLELFGNPSFALLNCGARRLQVAWRLPKSCRMATTMIAHSLLQKDFPMPCSPFSPLLTCGAHRLQCLKELPNGQASACSQRAPKGFHYALLPFFPLCSLVGLT
eukprot:scaffold106934_cov15-Tisochrysis_lutea.AAC.2